MAVHSSPSPLHRLTPVFIGTFAVALLLLLASFFLSGCSSNMVYKRSIGDLNTNAQKYLQSGDAKTAICRLESARELDPTEPITMRNLATAYHTAQMYDLAIPLYKELVRQTEGVDKATVLGGLAVVYEDQADRLLDRSKGGDGSPFSMAGTDNAEPLSDMARNQLLSQSLEQYQMALDTYTLAIEEGHPQSAGYKKHIDELASHMKQLKETGVAF